MPDRQRDLFSARGTPVECPVAPMFRGSPITPGALDDDALIAAIPAASFMDAPALTEEAARRGLQAAIPALEALCCRFAGFGVVHSVPEQTAALSAMSVIGGAEAARAGRTHDRAGRRAGTDIEVRGERRRAAQLRTARR